jgi:3-hydroxyacyl-[acyl-carrier-protein] dehydratase
MSQVDTRAGTALAFDYTAITHLLPHRGDALFLDSATVNGWHVDAEASWAPQHPHLAGHFPDSPVVPAVFLVEAAAQAAGVAIMHASDDAGRLVRDDQILVLAGIKDVLIHKALRPSEPIRLAVDVEPAFENSYFFVTAAGHDRLGEKVVSAGLTIARVARSGLKA